MSDASSSIGSGHSLLLMCVSKPWSPMTQLLVHHHSFLRSRLIDRQLIKTHVVTTCVSWTRSTSTCDATVVTQKKVDFLFQFGNWCPRWRNPSIGGVCLRVRGERSWSLTLTVMRMLYQSVMYKTELRCNDIVLEIKITTLGLYDYGQNNYDDYFEQDWNHDYFSWLLIYF